MSDLEAKSFRDYFVNEVVRLNEKDIVKSFVDGKVVRGNQFSGYVIHMCDEGDCMNMFLIGVVDRLCDYCRKRRCSNCLHLEECRECLRCKKVSCQQKSCYQEYTISRWCRGKVYYCQKCIEIVKTEKDIEMMDARINRLEQKLQDALQNKG